MILIRAIEALWYRPHLPWWMYAFIPLEALFCYLSQRRRRKQGVIRHVVPVIVVGNITVGGTGKTPLLIHLVALLQTAGYCPAVISRGYAASASVTQPLLLTHQTTPNQAGDEPVLIAKRTGVPVCVYPKRNQAIAHLLNLHPECNVILSDDGLQHYALGRDIEIAVLDGQRGLGNGHCLPLGPLREPISRLAQVDFKVINGELNTEEGFLMTVQVDEVVSLNNPQRTRPLTSFAGQKAHIVTGIGNPQRFITTLNQVGLSVDVRRFPDHHLFQAADLHFDDSLPIFITEKDAVKCNSFKQDKVWYVPINVLIAPPFESLFLQRLKELNLLCKSIY